MRYIINTLGCKVNQYETQAMETLLRERGHEPAGEGESAELVIVKMCIRDRRCRPPWRSGTSPLPGR